MYRRDYPEIPSVHTIPFCDDRSCEADTCSCGFFADETTSLGRMVGPGGFVDPDDVAYLILNPIQGQGGYRFPSERFMDEVARLCETHDLTLIADESSPGWGGPGRCGPPTTTRSSPT